MRYKISRTWRCGRFFCVVKEPDEKLCGAFLVKKLKPRNAQSLMYQWAARFQRQKPQKNFFVGFHRILISNFIVIIQRTRKKHPKCTVRLFHFLNREFQGIAHFLTELTSKKLDGIFLPESLLLANWEEKVLTRQRFGCGCRWRTLTF